MTILSDVGAALIRQREKFGHKPLATDSQFSHILGEEFGEVCRGINQKNDTAIYKECIQCIAVIEAFLSGDLHYGEES